MNWVTLIMTLRVWDWQSESDLDNIRNSCDFFCFYSAATYGLGDSPFDTGMAQYLGPRGSMLLMKMQEHFSNLRQPVILFDNCGDFLTIAEISQLFNIQFFQFIIEKLFTWSGLISPSSFSFSSNFAAISGCFAVKNCLIKVCEKDSSKYWIKVLGTEHL